MNELVLPIPEPMEVAIGDLVSIQFAYRAGCSLEELQETVNAQMVSHGKGSLANMPLKRAA